MIQIIPVLIIAPAYIAGKVEFGVITQSTAAFATAVAAFSLVVTQFQSLSAFAAVSARLRSMAEALDQAQTAMPAIEIVESDGLLAYEGLTLTSPAKPSPLMENLSITIPAGGRVLAKGADPTAGIALFRATAGLWGTGKGRIVRPRENGVLFLAQKPYLPPGSLRQALASQAHEDEISDERMLGLIRELNLEHVLNQAGGFDSPQDWATLVSLREQQLLACIHCLLAAPRVVLMDRIQETLTSDEVSQILGMLSRASIAYVSNGASGDLGDLYDTVLDCKEDGAWTWTTAGSLSR
jgi:putative ATP-binding cassette transporter